MSSSAYAEFWLRFVAFIIDSIILSVLYLLLYKPFFGMLLPIKYEEFAEMTSQGYASVNAVSVSSYLGYAEWTFIITTIFYHAIMESSRYQASLGKLALELKVTDGSGNPIRFSKALLRNGAKLISSAVLMIGFAMAAFTARKQALHDFIADTCILKKDAITE